RASGPPRRHPGAAGARRPGVPAKAPGGHDRGAPGIPGGLRGARARGGPPPGGRRASLTAPGATGFKAPERARQNLQLILEGRPLVPYAAHLATTLERLYPLLLDALWKSPDPDEALNQFERLLGATGPRAGLVELLVKDPDLLLGLIKVCSGGDHLTELLIAQPELLASLASPERVLARKSKAALRQALASVFVSGTTPAERRDRLRRVKQAEELAVVWRYVLGITAIRGYSRG